MCSVLYFALTWLKDNGPMDRPFQHQMCMHITGQGCAIHHIQWAVRGSSHSPSFSPHTFATVWQYKIKPPCTYSTQSMLYFTHFWKCSQTEVCFSALLWVVTITALICFYILFPFFFALLLIKMTLKLKMQAQLERTRTLLLLKLTSNLKTIASLTLNSWLYYNGNISQSCVPLP